MKYAGASHTNTNLGRVLGLALIGASYVFGLRDYLTPLVLRVVVGVLVLAILRKWAPHPRAFSDLISIITAEAIVLFIGGALLFGMHGISLPPQNVILWACLGLSAAALLFRPGRFTLSLAALVIVADTGINVLDMLRNPEVIMPGTWTYLLVRVLMAALLFRALDASTESNLTQPEAPESE